MALEASLKGLRQAQREPEGNHQAETSKPQRAKKTQALTPLQATDTPVSRNAGRPGRPATGKRSNPSYGRLTVYLPNELRIKAERKWQDTTGGKEASDLVEHLLTAYVGD